MTLCKFCNKECKNDNSLRNHQRLCKQNPNKQISWLEENREIVSQKNGATKAKEENREFYISQDTRKKISVAILGRTPQWNKENGNKISQTINDKVTKGDWHTSLAKKMHVDYNGIDLHGSWELKYAKYLDFNNIKWVRNKQQFPYLYDGKERRYTPDFYLINMDEYIEIKGYKTNKDIAKWNQFPSCKKLKILMENELKELGII